MKLLPAVIQYIEYRQSMGVAFTNEAKILRMFCRENGEADIEDVTPTQVRLFLQGKGAFTFYWYRKYEALLGFYRYALVRAYASQSPLPDILPKPPQPFRPYIYSPEEVRRLLKATDAPQPVWSKIPAYTMRTLLLLLYGAGLRISEALNLTLNDVDFESNVLTIVRSKFYKSRLVPVGPDLASVLKSYFAQRQKSRNSSDSEAPFLCSRYGKPIGLGNARSAFSRLRTQANVCRNDGAHFQPRLHDFRHSFAVCRLLAWYREGANVQHLLPYLSTYLGHISLAATQRYLTLTPELLCEAGKRFEQYAIPEVSNA